MTNLVILQDYKSDLRAYLEDNFNSSDEFVTTSILADWKVNTDNILYVDTKNIGHTELLSDPVFKAALENHIPIVLNQPDSSLMAKISGTGIEDIQAAIIVKGVGPNFYIHSYINTDKQPAAVAGHAQYTVPENELLRQESETPVQIASNASHSTTKTTFKELILGDLQNLKHIDSKLKELSENYKVDDSVPENRTWSVYWETSWYSVLMVDPSGESAETQRLRFRYSLTFRLTATDEPVKVKLLNIVVGGTGFDPILEGENMIRDDNKHRGYAQSLTSLEFSPTSSVFGNIEDYIPANQAGEVSVTAGYDWSITADTGGKVSAKYGQSSSHTKSSSDFRTLTSSEGNYGIKFYHNTNIVGGDTEVDPRNFFGTEWTDDMGKMFYYHFPEGYYVRSWPSLSKELLKPDSESVWYANANESRTGTLAVVASHGMNYFYHKSNTHHN